MHGKYYRDANISFRGPLFYLPLVVLFVMVMELSAARYWPCVVCSCFLSVLGNVIKYIHIKYIYSIITVQVFHNQHLWISYADREDQSILCTWVTITIWLQFSFRLTGSRWHYAFIEENLVLVRQRTPRRSSSIWLMWPPPTRPREIRSVLHHIKPISTFLWFCKCTVYSRP